ncbi:hypothetical protein HPP92_001480 [Vanilla planifolia]|uniref:Uncharacterized protein n=1 Tax=Vanilla planifolia TaxID=51239 RepID=A0A835RRR4_VANPL|nr:hypothetical protein HPP92_001480 [Vanilla planifolia]
MRKLCPNLDREDGLDTVLEVPIPEEMFSASGSDRSSRSSGATGCTNMVAWMRSHVDQRSVSSAVGFRSNELQLMLGVVGAPLVPVPVPSYHTLPVRSLNDDPIVRLFSNTCQLSLLLCSNSHRTMQETSMAKYIVQQYVAATGGEKALSKINSMYAMGKVRIAGSDLRASGGGSGKKMGKGCGGGGDSGELGGFVYWHKGPDLWCLELVVSGCKISAGSDGKVAWRQTPWQQSHASRGPPRPLRRSLQGLDPSSTAKLFASAICIGEKTINGEDCFVLRLDAEAASLRARSSSNVEIIRHTLWGYFSQRTALLVQLEDSHLLRIKAPNRESIYWETTMDSSIGDYRPVDGVNIAHAGRTTVSLFRFGETADGNTRTRMEETWTVEEVDFNIWGLSMDFFMPPGDINHDREHDKTARKDTVAGQRPPALGNLQGQTFKDCCGEHRRIG